MNEDTKNCRPTTAEDGGRDREAESGAPDLADEVVRAETRSPRPSTSSTRRAETQNVRRRLEQEKTDAAAYAATGFARDMLGVADNLARALAALPGGRAGRSRRSSRHRGDRARAE